MNILPKRRVITNLPKIEPEPVVEEKQLESTEETVDEMPTEEDMTKLPEHKENTVFEEKKTVIQEKNYIEPKPPTPKKKKKKLSEKQLAHLASMREKSRTIRAKRVAGKKEAQRLKRLEKEKKKLERAKKEQEKAKRRVVRQEKSKKLVNEADKTRNQYRGEGYNMAFKEFFGYMDRYDRMKSIRKRNNKEKMQVKVKPKARSNPITVPKPTNPYANWF